MAKRKKGDEWPYSRGKRATRTEPTSRVRVYERPDIPGRIFMTRAWVLTSSGRPVEVVLPEGTTQEAARRLVDRTVSERRLAVLEGRTDLGTPKPITLGELIEKYHGWLESQDRSAKTLDDNARCRKFWRNTLDPTTSVLDLTSAQVEKIASSARKKLGLTARWDKKRLAYLRAVVLWGLNKERLYDVNPLRGLTMPEYTPDTQGKDYTATESMLLATPHPEVDWRVTLTASIICDTGRRISSVLSISTERDLVVIGDRLHVIFRKEYDKGRRGAIVPVSADTHLLIADALDRTEVQESGWLIPEGRDDYDDPVDKPLNKKAVSDQLHRAEKVLGIPYVPGRAWHGLKRTHVTMSWEEAGGDAGLVGDITGNVDPKLLKDTYRQLSLKRTTAHVDRVRARLKEEANSEPSDGSETDE
ncbi:MAG: hypothetical protein OEZ65_15885 [Gemmatimonadota bacterium]|nr:hypothetical protein [Gemmatimonadota bacterium]